MLARRWLLAAGLTLAVGAAGFYLTRDAAFAHLAAGTRWVLVACGFETADGAPGMGAQRLRALFYAVRMFRDVPPATLSADDAWADARYPGMGFGLVRTLDPAPVRVVLDGWRYVVPCVYFADARDCRRPDLNTARLRVSLPDLRAMTRGDIPRFLAVADPGVVTITVVGAGQAGPPWPLPPASASARRPRADIPGTQTLLAYAWKEGGDVLYAGAADGGARLLCTPPSAAAALGIAAQCRDRFAHGAGVQVELRYAFVHLPDWPRLRFRARQRLDEFRYADPGSASSPASN